MSTSSTTSNVLPFDPEALDPDAGVPLDRVPDPEVQPVPEGEGLPVEVQRAVDPQPLPEDVSLDDPRLLFNRELSWVDFNWRVLAMALDERTPLLERAHFLAITASNLDEFYRKRIGGLKRQLEAGVRALSPDGRTPREQLDLVIRAAVFMQARMATFWEESLRPDLREAGIEVRDYETLSEDERDYLSRYFQKAIFPILTPLAVDSGHPFPFISNQSLSLAFTLRHPVRETRHFARLKVPTSRGRWVRLPDSPGHVVPLEAVIRHNAESLFRGMNVESVYNFRVTRNADVDRNEEEADDLLSMISEELRERKFAEVVRLEVEQAMPQDVRDVLMREMSLGANDVVEVPGLFDFSDLASLPNRERSDFQFEPWEPVVPIRLRHLDETDDADNLFNAIRKRDVLVHHPYESFAASTQRFIEEAASDPKVLAIKQTLYRTSRNSPIVRALVRAAESGKQVAVLVELKARFDEENNIEWAQRLERAGAHVAYGLVGLKTHAKSTLVVREEHGRLQTYCHLGTGNYNPSTARLYTDFGLLTRRDDIGQDLVQLFHYLTGYAPEQEYQTLLVAPRDLRRRFTEMVHREVRRAEEGRRGRIIAKMNGLDDEKMIQELYRASRAGVEIDLIVRGHCRLRPGVPGISDNIRVISIVGRFLEHSRIFYFHNNDDPDLFIGSADWMRRNLEDRVEIVAPVIDAEAKARLCRTLAFALADNRLAWELHADGRYVLRTPPEGAEELAFHDILMKRARRRTEADDAAWSL